MSWPWPWSSAADPLAETDAIPTEPPRVPAKRSCKPPTPPRLCARCGVDTDGTYLIAGAEAVCLGCAPREVTR